MKQIEEMGKLCPFREEDKCNLLEDEGVCDFDCDMCNYADALYNAGYRKQSEVSREIFEEIEKKIKVLLTLHLEELNKEYIKDTPEYDRHSGIIFALQHMEDFIAELKNKYTEVEK